MKRITITLDEQLANWVRLHAAELGISVSRLIGQMVGSRMRDSRAYDSAMRRFLARKPVILGTRQDGLPDRGSLHDRG